MDGNVLVSRSELLASERQNVASSERQNVSSEGQNVASERQGSSSQKVTKRRYIGDETKEASKRHKEADESERAGGSEGPVRGLDDLYWIELDNRVDVSWIGLG
jgi:phage protein D